MLGQEHVDPFITRGILLDVLSVKLAQGDQMALGEPVNGNPILADSYRITVEDLQDAMKFGGIRQITPGDVVIIRTGWSHLVRHGPGAAETVYRERSGHLSARGALARAVPSCDRRQ